MRRGGGDSGDRGLTAASSRAWSYRSCPEVFYFFAGTEMTDFRFRFAAMLCMLSLRFALRTAIYPEKQHIFVDDENVSSYAAGRHKVVLT